MCRRPPRQRCDETSPAGATCRRCFASRWARRHRARALPRLYPVPLQEVKMASRFPVPFSSSRELRGGDPLQDLHREMNRLFENVFSGGGLMGMGSQGGGMSVLRLDVRDTGREICISAEVPGVNPSEVDLRLEG